MLRGVRIRTLALLILCVCCSPAAFAQELPRPLIQLTVQSFDRLREGTNPIGVALGFGPEFNAGSAVEAFVGNPALPGVDRSRPWQVAFSSADDPAILIYIPVTDFAAFSAGLPPSSELRSPSFAGIVEAGSYAVAITRPQRGPVLPIDRQRATVWAPLGPGPSSLVELTIQMDNTSRAILGQGLAIVRGALSQAAAGQPAAPGLPAGPGVAQAVNDYLDLIESITAGVDQVRVQADVNDQAIVFTQRLTPLPGSPLETSLAPVPGGVSSVASQLPSSAPVAVAAAVGSTPMSRQLVKSLLGITLQLPGMGGGNPSSNSLDQLIQISTPVKVASSLEFVDTLSYTAIYEFPGKDVAEVYKTLMKTMESSLSSMTGVDQIYASTELQQNSRSVGGVSLDRMSMTLNLDHPLLQTPEIREVLKLFYGGNRIDIEYGIKDQRLFIGNPPGMTTALTASPQSAAALLDATPNTVLLGRVNPARLLRQVVSNPAIPVPPELKTLLERLSPDGTDVRMRIELDGQLHGRLEVPLKLLEALRAASQARPVP